MFKTTKQQKDEIESLKNYRDALLTEVAILKARTGLDDPNEEVSAQVDNLNLSVPNDQPEGEYNEPQVLEPRPIKGAIKTTMSLLAVWSLPAPQAIS